jgi:hypothetical protein
VRWEGAVKFPPAPEFKTNGPSICRQHKPNKVEIFPIRQLRYPIHSIGTVVDFGPEWRINKAGRTVLPVRDIYNADVPQSVRKEMKPSNEAGFIIQSQIVEGWIVPGYPIVYIPAPDSPFRYLRRPPVPNWADYSISRVTLNEGREQVELIRREDWGIRE